MARGPGLGKARIGLDGQVVARVTSGGYGHTVASSIAYAYLEAEPGAKVEVEVDGAWVAGSGVSDPLYDAAGERLR